MSQKFKITHFSLATLPPAEEFAGGEIEQEDGKSVF